jgi:hypothetical protein
MADKTAGRPLAILFVVSDYVDFAIDCSSS